MPTPVKSQRDDQGRLIALVFESSPSPVTGPTAERWLVAVDGSSHSIHALKNAARLATESGVRTLDLVNVQPWFSKEAAETELPRRGWAATADARALLDAQGFGWQLHVWMGVPAERISELAQALNSRGIAIGARGLTLDTQLLLGSVAQDVIHTAPCAVLVVRATEAPLE